MTNYLLLLALCLFFFLSSCDKEDSGPVLETHISHITLEEYYTLGQTHGIEVTIVKPTPYHVIEEEPVNLSGKTHSFDFNLIQNADSCIEVLAREEKLSLNFEPAMAGEHTIKFYINDELYETRTVTVTEK